MQCLTQQPTHTHAYNQPARRYQPSLGSALLCLLSLGLVITMLLTPIYAQAKIYKTVDEDGNVSYSDVPPADTKQRTESTIELEINNTYSSKDSAPAPVGASNPGDIVSADGTAPDPAAAQAYKSIAISAPAANTTLRSNSGDVTLGISLQPSLRAGDQVRFFMDGKPVGTVNGTSLALTNVDRGTHTLAAVVLDGAGKPKISSTTTSFTIQRFAPKPPAPPANNNAGT